MSHLAFPTWDILSIRFYRFCPLLRLVAHLLEEVQETAFQRALLLLLHHRLGQVLLQLLLRLHLLQLLPPQALLWLWLLLLPQLLIVLSFLLCLVLLQVADHKGLEASLEASLEGEEYSKQQASPPSLAQPASSPSICLST